MKEGDTMKTIIFLLIIIPISLISWTQTGPSGAILEFMVIDDITGYVYVATRGEKLYKIDTDNNTWINIETPEPTAMILSLDAYDDHIYLGREGHILHSADGGNTWVYANNGITQDIAPSIIKICRTEPNIILVQIGYLNIWYRSTNYGQLWLRTHNIGTNVVDMTHNSDFKVAISHSRIYKSFNNGETWIDEPQSFDTDFLTNISIINDSTYIISLLQENDFYGENNIFITYDGAQNWENINFGCRLSLPIDILYHNDRIYVNCSYMKTEQDLGGIFELDIENQTWNRLVEGIVNEPFGYVIGGYNEYLYLAHYYEGLFEINIDTGDINNHLPTDIFEKSIAYLNVNQNFNNYVYTTFPYFHFSDDYGNSWNRIDSVYSVFDLKQSHFDPEIFIALRPRIGVIMSYDGAQSWSISNNGIEANDEVAISKCHFLTDNIIIISGYDQDEGVNQESFIYRSEDQGQNWEKILETDMTQGEPYISLFSICRINNTFYACMLEQGIMRSEDYGLTWESVFFLPDTRFYELEHDQQNGILYTRTVNLFTSPGQTILYRSDNFIDWEQCSDSFDNEYWITDLCVNPNESEKIYCSVRNRDGEWLGQPHLYYSGNSGDSWQSINIEGLSSITYIHTMCIIQETNEILICPTNMSILKNDLDFVSIEEEIISDIVPINLNNYPNPFNSKTTISFSLNKTIIVNAEISIYNIKGQKVNQFSIDDCRSSIEWNGKDENGKLLNSGVYFYKLNVNDETKAVRKMVILK